MNTRFIIRRIYIFSSKKPDPFFNALYDIAVNCNKAAHYAEEFKITSIADLKELSVTLKKYETEEQKDPVEIDYQKLEQENIDKYYQEKSVKKVKK